MQYPFYLKHVMEGEFRGTHAANLQHLDYKGHLYLGVQQNVSCGCLWMLLKVSGNFAEV